MTVAIEPHLRAAVRVPVDGFDAAAYAFPTERPESDGTLEWDRTEMVWVAVRGGGKAGYGYTYGHRSAALIATDLLRPLVVGRDALNPAPLWHRMRNALRNAGRPGVASHALAAVDGALWDLKARLLGQPLSALVGSHPGSVPAYASGGFTSRSIEELRDEAASWAAHGFRAVKIKVGRNPVADARRVWAARNALSRGVDLYVDANGAYDESMAARLAGEFAEAGVSWLEEPLSSDDEHGLARLRARVPARIRIAAGEYGYDPESYRRLLEAAAVDVLQIDATRCQGVTGFLKAAALADAHDVSVSSHTAPSLHASLAGASPRFRVLEYFHDHVRIEQRYLDGAPKARGGRVAPPDAPGFGFAPKIADMEEFRTWGGLR